MPGRIEFLQQLDLFRELTEDEIIDLARVAKEYEFEDGAVIAYQRDVADSMYIVREGRLYVQRLDTSGAVRESKAYTSGEYFGEKWLFAPATHPATIKGRGNGRVIIIDGTGFLSFLSAHLDALDALAPQFDEATGELVAGLPQDVWDEATKYSERVGSDRAPITLLPDEVVEYKTRGSVKWLIATELAPILIFLVVLPFIYSGTESLGDSIFWFIGVPIMAVIGLLVTIFSVLEIIDWYVDYLIITNKHLVVREFELSRAHIKSNQIPISQIQSVQTLKPDFLSNFLGIGTVRITTASSVGTIDFDRIDNPIAVEETINRLTMRVKAISEAESQAIMRKSLEDYFEQPPAYHQVTLDDVEIQTAPAEPTPSFFNSILNRYRWRVIEGDVTTYRKHFFVLIREVAAPTIMGIILIALWWNTHIYLINMPSAVLWFVFGLLGFFNFIWFIWQIEDWRNDTFQVTSRFVIDVDRKPLGFAENRKQAPLSVIQNVNAERPGLLPTIFNYGFVQVETAGADADIQFEKVSRPSEIQSDIFRRLDEFQQQQRLNEGRQRRKEYAILMDVYKQATEQSRIPRRTPDQEEVALLDETDANA